MLSNTAHKIGTEASWNERIAAVNAGGSPSIADIVMQRWFTPAYRRPDNADFVGYLAMFTRTPVDGYVGTCASVRDADLTESTRALKVPTLCIGGDQDGTTPPDLVRSMADLIRNSEFRIIADAGHYTVHRAAGGGRRPDRHLPPQRPLRLRLCLRWPPAQNHSGTRLAAIAMFDRLAGRRRALTIAS